MAVGIANEGCPGDSPGAIDTQPTTTAPTMHTETNDRITTRFLITRPESAADGNRARFCRAVKWRTRIRGRPGLTPESSGGLSLRVLPRQPIRQLVPTDRR